MKVLSILLFCLIPLSIYSQDNYPDEDILWFPSDDYVEKCMELPVVRPILGGTVINVKYEGDWTNEMKGAFEYACKIWEENIPPCLPLRVTAVIADLSSNGNPISKSNPKITTLRDFYNENTTSYSSRVKGVLLKEYEHGENFQFMTSLYSSIFSDEDLTIIYNKNRLDEISFSLYAIPENKYDFVSLVLRDLSTMVGIHNSVYAMNNLLYWRYPYPTHYERKIWSQLSPDNPSESYLIATSDSIPTSLCGRRLYLYAPSHWADGLSLNSFYPDSTSNFSQLLSYNFGKGSVVRNITDEMLNYMFTEELGWNCVITTGMGPSTDIESEGSTDNNVAYRGEISLEDFETTTFLKSPTKYVLKKSNNESHETLQSMKSKAYNAFDSIRPYSVVDPNELEAGPQFKVSLLKKDGTWDCVYSFSLSIPAQYRPRSINVSDFELHCSKNDYARTCDGKLRCRLSSVEQSGNYNNVQAKYYVIEELPQIIDMKFSRLSKDQIDDEYLRDVEIGIKNLEGTESLYVEHWIEGDTYPQLYEITDFKKGYFTVTVDKEFYSEFRVTAYNKNGSTMSEIYRMEPLEPADFEYCVSINDDFIELSQPEGRRASRGRKVSYQIFPIDVFEARVSIDGQVVIGESPSIDISSLDRGLYGLRYTDADGNWRSVKFMKK